MTQKFPDLWYLLTVLFVRLSVIIFYLHAVPRVQFSPSSYTVSESQGWLEVCTTVDLHVELGVEISATITSQNNTADSKCQVYLINNIGCKKGLHLSPLVSLST